MMLLPVDSTVPRLALRAKDAALSLGISERQLWEKTKVGEIPHARIGGCVVYPVEALRQYLADLLERAAPHREAAHADLPRDRGPVPHANGCSRATNAGINNAGCNE